MFESGKPRWFLRLDGLVLVVATVFLFAAQHQRWWLYLALFLVPDLSMVGYLKDTVAGALLYNVGHSYLAPAVTIFVGWRTASPLTVAVGLIWLGHIGWDRLLGYGLKYDDGFTFTHLGRIGPSRAESVESHDAPGRKDG
jgi:Domain of unknown function (DUF4260)